MSMKKNVRLARDLGALTIPDASVVDIEEVDKLPPEKVCIISTGSQGEPMSALGLMASGDNRWLKVGEHDTVILSSHAIPGNEFNVNRVIDGLLRNGAEVIHSGVADVHATGHAQADELKTLLSITRPEHFVPIHGEYRHMVAHAKLAAAMGVPAPNIALCEDGDVITLSDQGLEVTGRVPAGYLYVDGIVGDVGQGVLRDRRVLAEEGVVVVVASRRQRQQGADRPGDHHPGLGARPEAEALLDEACDRVAEAVERALQNGVRRRGPEREVRRAAGSS
jgi:ribonuclease J